MLVSELSVIHVSIVQMEMCGIFQMELMKQLLFSRMLEVSRIKYIFFLLNHCFLLRRVSIPCHSHKNLGLIIINNHITRHCALTGRRDWLRRRKQLKLRFGSVVPISGSDFVREVSQAPSDVWVVVILYKDGALKNLSQDIL
ncbi:hypothetical protein Ahy_B08g091432 [Arachis hypogaea]|uniref:Uncharacterized protein n=1 Tax=Arachis hypogaea TaxID=3818 RepID=A0A444Y252_ARAHY|nr:hypothetical protein Ahy_B08g091432 [Arachis hypogaea]